MAWLLVAVTGALAALCVVLVALTVHLRRRLDAIETRLAERPAAAPTAPTGLTGPAVRPEPEFVITRVGEPEPPVEPVPTVAAPLFADIVARETVVQAASLAAGLRRALAPETRNRIRFHMRAEVKRSRKQRKVELREVRREWAARQREGRAA